MRGRAGGNPNEPGAENPGRVQRPFRHGVRCRESWGSKRSGLAHGAVVRWIACQCRLKCGAKVVQG